MYYGLEIAWRMINKTINRPARSTPHWIFISEKWSVTDKVDAELDGREWNPTPDRLVCSQCGRANSSLSDIQVCQYCGSEMTGEIEYLDKTIDMIRKEVLEEMEAKK